MVNLSPSSGFPNMYDSINNRIVKHGNNVTILVVLTLIIIGYYFTFKSLGTNANINTTNMGGNGGMKYIELLMWGVLIFLVIINGLQYFFSIDIQAAVKDIFSPVPEVKVEVSKNDGVGLGDDDEDEDDDTIPEIMGGKQVFHIPSNKYSYQEAGALCKAYDARLATLDEVEKAYQEGGEWCSYGWSANQLALYPTQKDTYKKLKEIDGHEHDCGRAGINGGYIKNPNVRFGVNCFGNKPKASEKELKYMKDTEIIPTSYKDKQFEKKVDYYKKNIKKIMMAPFNKNKWSYI